METLFNNSSVCSPPVKYNSFTCGGGIFGFAKNDLEKEESVQEETNTSAATAPTNSTYWDASASRVDTTWIGNGTQADPWLITSAAELAGLSYSIYNNTKSSYLTSSQYYYSGCYFKQTVDIDVSAYYWQPIGTSNSRSGSSIFRGFSGNYDGNGHTVSGVFTKSGSYAYDQGLFGYVSGTTTSNLASITNIGVINSYIQGYYRVGGIVGQANYATMRNCYNTGSVNGNGQVGGIVGQGYYATISNCYNTGSVNGSGEVGGIMGWAYSNATITNCYNTGSVSGGSSGYTHGIAYNTSSTITNCYYGGNCTLTTGTNSGTATKDASLITNAKTLSWYQDTTKWNSTYPWDFNDIWEIRTGENDGYPVFRIKTWNDYAANSYASGSGTASSPYIIKTPEQLAKISVDSQNLNISGNYYKLAANIDLSAHEWVPIGVGQAHTSYGIFDGDFYCINNLNISIYDNVRTGLFATVYAGCTVKNLVMENAQIERGETVGAVSGLADGGGTIQNCIVKGSNLTSTFGARYTGGIVGWLWNSNIKSCQVQNSTMSGYTVGGIFGYEGGTATSNVTDNGCYGNTITGTRAGGALYGGYISGATMNFNGCYAQGVVNGTASKVMYGDSTAWANWTYNSMLNGDYPVQTTLFHIGGLSGSTNVYNYLKNILGFTVA